MKRFFLALLLMVLPAFALADLVARQGSDSVRLRMTPCANATVFSHLGRIEPTAPKEEFRVAQGIFGGKTFEACWQPIQGGVYLIYEDGDQGLIPRQELREDLGV